jgi:hypothetical protein
MSRGFDRAQVRHLSPRAGIKWAIWRRSASENPVAEYRVLVQATIGWVAGSNCHRLQHASQS